MALYDFRILRSDGAPSILRLELPDIQAVEAQAEELARILVGEASKLKRLADTGTLHVSDSSGNLVITSLLSKLASRVRTPRR